MQSSSYYIEILKKFKSTNASKFGIRRIGIFGSVARGEQNLNSDLDVFVDLINPDYFLLCDLHDNLEQLCKCQIDLVHMHKYLRPLFLENIERDVIFV